MLSRLLEAHELILTDAHDAATQVAEQGDDGTNDLIVSEVIRTGELQAWFLAEHLVDTPLVRAVSRRTVTSRLRESHSRARGHDPLIAAVHEGGQPRWTPRRVRVFLRRTPRRRGSFGPTNRQSFSGCGSAAFGVVPVLGRPRGPGAARARRTIGETK